MTQREARVSFDMSTLSRHLNANDPLALVIRAHLYVEAALTRKIESALVNQSGFDSAKLPYPTKVKLAVGLGKIDARDVGGLIGLNGLRNRFAHDLDTQLNEQDERDLYNGFSTVQQRIADSLREPDMVFMGKLRCDLIAIIVSAELQ